MSLWHTWSYFAWLFKWKVGSGKEALQVETALRAELWHWEHQELNPMWLLSNLQHYKNRRSWIFSHSWLRNKQTFRKRLETAECREKERVSAPVIFLCFFLNFSSSLSPECWSLCGQSKYLHVLMAKGTVKEPYCLRLLFFWATRGCT